MNVILKIIKDPIVIACMLVLCFGMGWLVFHAANGSQQIILRNSLLAEQGEPQDFSWLPDAAPKAFRDDREYIPNEFIAIARSIASIDAEGFQGLQLIATHLLAIAGDERSIKQDTLTTYQKIRSDGDGYCADYSQVFTAIALASNVPVREWGFSTGDFGGGHAFTEVYSEAYDKWVFADVFSGFYLLSVADNRPVSVEELRQGLLSDSFSDFKFVRFNPEIFRFRDERQAWEFYQSGAQQFYLWWGNDIFAYEGHPFVAALSSLPRAVENLAAIAVGVHPGYRVVPNGANQASWETLMTLRNQLIVLAVLLLLSGIVLLLRASMLFCGSKRAAGSNEPAR